MEDINLYLITQKQLIELEYYKLKTHYTIFSKIEINDIIKYYDDIVNKRNKAKQDNLFLSKTNINKLLNEYNDGIFGILNYFSSEVSVIDFLKENKYEYYNKPGTIDKLLLEKNIGILFLYCKTKSTIEDLHKVYLLKNGEINYLNDQNDETILTKIYEFGNKIVLKNIIYELISDEIPEEEKQLEYIYKLLKKYNKSIDDNVKQLDIKQLYNNYSFINTVLKKIADPTKKQLDIFKVIKFDYSTILDKMKISNRLEQEDYDTIIERYYDETLDTLINNTLDTYNLNNNFRQYMNTIFDILLRMYIDNYLGYKSFCLSKTLLEYIKFTNISVDPETNTSTLKRRHWNQLLESKDNKKIVSSIIFLIKTKTYTLDNTFKYFELIYREVKIKY